MIIWPAKGPNEVEDFAFDFAPLLESGETISGRTVTAEGVVKDSDEISGSQVKVWLSGGIEGTLAKVTCTVTTSGGRTYSELAALLIGSEAVSLATAKQAQKIERTDEDLLLAGFLRASIAAVETATGKNLTPKIVSQTAHGFPCSLRLWKGPVSQVLSVKYDDADGAEQTLSSFRLVEGSNANLLPAFGESFPATAPGPGTVRITYVAGYAPGEMPPELAQAAILLFGHFNANREAVALTGGSAAAVELPLGVQWLIDPYRMPGIA